MGKIYFSNIVLTSTLYRRCFLREQLVSVSERNLILPQIKKNMKGTFTYNPTDFDPKKPKSPAWTFGISRSFFEKVYNEAEFYHDKSFPGPGQYKYTKPFGSQALKYSLYGRQPDKGLGTKSKIPGPGTYQLTELKPDGKYTISRFRNTTGIIWGSSKEKRFSYKEKINAPGPGKYEIRPLITGEGKIFNSKHKSNMGKTMGCKFFDPSSKLKTPGPGSYRMFSEFGIYESKYAKAQEKTNESMTFLKTEPNFYPKKKLLETVTATNTNSFSNTHHTEPKK